jgi:hypothetical protein
MGGIARRHHPKPGRALQAGITNQGLSKREFRLATFKCREEAYQTTSTTLHDSGVDLFVSTGVKLSHIACATNRANSHARTKNSQK